MRGARDLPEALQRLAGEPGARRIDDDHVGVARPRPQVCEHLADVAGEERGVADRVQLLVLDRAGDGLLADLDPPHRHRILGHREPDRPDAAVEVVDGLVARQPGELARDRVELLRHLGVRLQEGVRTHAEAQAADLLFDRVLAPDQLGRQLGRLGDALVDRPVDRLDLAESRSAPRSSARGRSARRGSSRAARVPGPCCALRGPSGGGDSPRASPGRTPSASPRAPSRASCCGSRCRRRS